MGLDLATLAQAFGSGVGGYLQGRTEKRRADQELADRAAESEREAIRWEAERRQQAERDAVAKAAQASLDRSRAFEEERYETQRAEGVASRGARARGLEEAVMRGAGNEQDRARINAALSKLPDDEAGIAFLEQELARQEANARQAGTERVAGMRLTADKPTRDERIMAHAQRLMTSGEMTPDEAYEQASALYDEQDYRAAVQQVRQKIAAKAPLSAQEQAVAEAEGLLPAGPIPDAFEQAIVNLRGPARPVLR